MLEAFTAITTSITAILSVYIAFKSHRTTINEKKIEKDEFSIKLMDLHKSKNSHYFNIIFVLSMLETPINEPKKIYKYIEQKDIYDHTVQYVRNTEKFKEERIEQLSLEDTERLSESISQSLHLLAQIGLLNEYITDDNLRSAMLKQYPKEEDIYQEQNKKIITAAKDLLDIF
ncbi:hypothetical protein [Salinicoccus halitifaciens]|uniref:Oligoribonuclease NrnB/cAMP/cGMP phosphodiesterase (DHH superfamily) n=1 Tax=Salinicoccus halitifaciens TaxID=1073415 RepID=A0ABV2E8K9_9STAP|nr:hypothetical protein [Salinicoccus halitifaciens]MCD2137877.1 hypothetical protein [Salinicoccus halitifaciens]